MSGPWALNFHDFVYRHADIITQGYAAVLPTTAPFHQLDCVPQRVSPSARSPFADPCTPPPPASQWRDSDLPQDARALRHSAPLDRHFSMLKISAPEMMPSPWRLKPHSAVPLANLTV